MDYELWKKPNATVVKEYAHAFDINYYKSEDELKKAFKYYSEDVVKDRIFLLEKYYNSGLKRNKNKDLYNSLEEYLIKGGEKLEDFIKRGDINVVEEIALIDGSNCFSFATKYCNFMNTEFYPIYDSQVVKTLNYFQYKANNRFYNERHLCLDKKRKNCDYKGFKIIIDSFRKHYKIPKSVSYKQLDEFLWIVGKNI